MMTPYGGLEGAPGAAPGVEHYEITALPGNPGQARVVCIDYSAGGFVEQPVEDLDEFLSRHRPVGVTVRWIDVAGLSDMVVIHALATKYELHPLAIEDLLNLNHRPKVEPYGGEDSTLRARLFIIARDLDLVDDRLTSRQISMFLGHNTVLTFQEQPVDAWDPVRQRLRAKGSRLRQRDASFLVYSLLDAVVDECFPVLEYYGELMEEIETVLLAGLQRDSSRRIHEIKQDLLVLRWVLWPMRESIAVLQREAHECISEETRVYLRDLYDHVVQLIEIVEVYRERASDLSESYMSAVSNRMNEIMKVLTIMGSIFIPLTFLAGVYGMNFHRLPELELAWGYPAFWIICAVVAGGLLYMFRRREWL